jgi:hypothetical protein
LAVSISSAQPLPLLLGGGSCVADDPLGGAAGIAGDNGGASDGRSPRSRLMAAMALAVPLSISSSIAVISSSVMAGYRACIRRNEATISVIW